MANAAAEDSCGAEQKIHVKSFGLNEEELQPIRQAVRSLPANAVKDLLSAEVCYRCICRLFGLYEMISSRPSLTASVLGSIFREMLGLGEDEVDNRFTEKHKDWNGQQCSQEFGMEQKCCPICLGILQFLYLEGNGMLVRKECASEFAATIAEAVKHERHQIDSFSLEVSLPSLVMEKENALRLYIKDKYSHEPWYEQMFVPELICVKEALKMSITDTLENLLGLKSCISSFRIRLTYTCASNIAQELKGDNGCNKRRKTGIGEQLVINHDSVAASVESSKTDVLVETASELQVHGLGGIKFLMEKVSQPCCLTYYFSRGPIYIGGRYLKYSRNVSQTRWIIDDERMGEASVEEIIGGNILPICGGDSYKFHAAGREDIDVRMLGTGRPFLVEVQNARQIPSEELIKEMEHKINSLAGKLVMIKYLKSLGNQGWDLMREGEAEKQKQYAALVWISRPLNDDDFGVITSHKDLRIIQKTPIRVLHRRSPLEREKIIHWMKIERIAGSSQLARISKNLFTETLDGRIQASVQFLSAEQRYFNLMSQMSKWIVSKINEDSCSYVVAIPFWIFFISNQDVYQYADGTESVLRPGDLGTSLTKGRSGE